MEVPHVLVVTGEFDPNLVAEPGGSYDVVCGSCSDSSLYNTSYAFSVHLAWRGVYTVGAAAAATATEGGTRSARRDGTRFCRAAAYAVRALWQFNLRLNCHTRDLYSSLFSSFTTILHFFRHCLVFLIIFSIHYFCPLISSFSLTQSFDIIVLSIS